MVNAAMPAVNVLCARGLLACILILPALPAGAHAPGKVEPQAFVFSWNLPPWLATSLLISVTLYSAGLIRLWTHAGYGHGVNPRQAGMFAGGWLALVLALASPLDVWSAWLFSAHMLQHELLMLVAAPLMAMGRPLAVMAWAWPYAVRKRLPTVTHARPLVIPWQWLMEPLVAWLLHALVLWAWHAPWLFQLALRSPPWHVMQHVSFYATALIFWWVVLSPRPSHEKRGWSLLLLFTTMLHTGCLGALLTMANHPWYPYYLASTRMVGMNAMEDQQLGGLIMWVPSALAYVLAMLIVGLRYVMTPAKRL